MGQPWRIRHLDEVLGHINAYQGVWKATGAEIIYWFNRIGIADFMSNEPPAGG